jgi:hypothetical protein
MESKDKDQEKVTHLKSTSDEDEKGTEESTLRRRKNVSKNSEDVLPEANVAEDDISQDELPEGTELEVASPEDEAGNIEYCESELEVVSKLLRANDSIEKS